VIEAGSLRRASELGLPEDERRQAFAVRAMRQPAEINGRLVRLHPFTTDRELAGRVAAAVHFVDEETVCV
jgi:hypothetical protein